MEKEIKEKNKKPVNRGAKDDIEALQMILEDNQALKFRVLNRLKALRRQKASKDKGINISEEQNRNFQMEKKRKK